MFNDMSDSLCRFSLSCYTAATWLLPYPNHRPLIPAAQALNPLKPCSTSSVTLPTPKRYLP
jgi:hypothetical protein